MARTLKVVFRSDVRGIAQAGDVKMVSPGYARNYLFPRQLAFPATDTALKQWETERQGTLAKVAHQREQAQTLATQIEGVTCTINAKAGDEGRLFGSVGRQEIAEALAKEGIKIDKRDVALAEPIKQLGQSVVPVRLQAGLLAQLKVNVVAEG
jgi:large subunit ribosomal protein L9